MTSGANNAHSSGGVAINIRGVFKCGGLGFDVTKFQTKFHVGFHGATHENDLAILLNGDVDDLLDAVQVTREARNHHSFVGSLQKQSSQGATHAGLRRRKPGLFGVGGVTQQQTDAFVAQGRQPGNIGASPINRGQIQFEIARVHDDADGRVNGERVRRRYRVSDRNELDLKRTNASTFAILNFDKIQFRRHASFG